MAQVLDDTFTADAGEVPAYSAWGEVGAATSVDAAVTVANNVALDLWVQWADDPSGSEPEDVDVFAVGVDPENQGHYYVHADGLPPAGAYIRVKGVAYELAGGPCHVVITAN